MAYFHGSVSIVNLNLNIRLFAVEYNMLEGIFFLHIMKYFLLFLHIRKHVVPVSQINHHNNPVRSGCRPLLNKKSIFICKNYSWLGMIVSSIVNLKGIHCANHSPWLNYYKYQLQRYWKWKSNDDINALMLPSPLFPLFWESMQILKIANPQTNKA